MRYLFWFALTALSTLHTPSAFACSKIVFQNAEYGSPLIVEATIATIEDGIATLTLIDTLRKPEGALPLPLRILITEVGYDSACRPLLTGRSSLEVGDRAFLMLIPNTLDARAPWRPAGDYGAGIRRIEGEMALKGGHGRWRLDVSTAQIRENVRIGLHMLTAFDAEHQQKAWDAACMRGDGEKCRWLARTIGADDPTRGTQLLRRGCQGRDEESCLQYGLVLSGGRVVQNYDSVPAEVADVAWHISHDCAGGDASACAIRERALAAAEDALR